MTNKLSCKKKLTNSVILVIRCKCKSYSLLKLKLGRYVFNSSHSPQTHSTWVSESLQMLSSFSPGMLTLIQIVTFVIDHYLPEPQGILPRPQLLNNINAYIAEEIMWHVE